jgi:hypothetical protein
VGASTTSSACDAIVARTSGTSCSGPSVREVRRMGVKLGVEALV